MMLIIVAKNTSGLQYFNLVMVRILVSISLDVVLLK